MEGQQLTQDFSEPLIHRRVVKPQERSFLVGLYPCLAELLNSL